MDAEKRKPVPNGSIYSSLILKYNRSLNTTVYLSRGNEASLGRVNDNNNAD